METCDICGEEIDDWMLCPDCGRLVCWPCVDAGAMCPCGCQLDEEV